MYLCHRFLRVFKTVTCIYVTDFYVDVKTATWIYNLAELRCQMMVRTAWLKDQERKLERRLSEYMEMASQPLIPVQKSKLNKIQEGARMYLNHSLIKVGNGVPIINAQDIYRFMGEDPTQHAVMSVQHLKPPTLWEMEMPESIMVYTTKANRYIYMQCMPF